MSAISPQSVGPESVGAQKLGPQSVEARPRRSTAIALNRGAYWASRNWLVAFSVIWGLYVGLPWLAPVFMRLGWTPAGNAIYSFYSTQCHQLPERSYFLFGPQATYSLEAIGRVWKVTADPLVLRQFIGNAQYGWKVAWSDRMVSMYTTILLFGWLWWPMRKRARPLSLLGYGLLLLPMFVDGVTHMISDFAGIGQGFRDTNAWLATLTGNLLPATFYAGDALGSFNSWMRIISGVLFALGTVWVAFPYVETAMADTAAAIEAKFARAGLKL